jgi:hypothetical protein
VQRAFYLPEQIVHLVQFVDPTFQNIGRVSCKAPQAQRSQALCFARNLHLRKFSISEVVSDLCNGSIGVMKLFTL